TPFPTNGPTTFNFARTAMICRLSMPGATLTCVLSFVLMTAAAAPAQVKAPDWKHGLEFRVRKADEADFNDKTNKIGCEVYSDSVTNQLLYISESGPISATAGTAPGGGETKKPTWLHGLKLSARKADEKEFGKDT